MLAEESKLLRDFCGADPLYRKQPMAKLLPELDPAKEEHAYLRRYKRNHFAHNPSIVNLLYGVSALQVCLLTLAFGPVCQVAGIATITVRKNLARTVPSVDTEIPDGYDRPWPRSRSVRVRPC